MVILVVYEPAPGTDNRREEIAALVEQHGDAHVQPTADSWLVDTRTELVTEWSDRIGGPGRVMVVHIRGRSDIQGFLPRELWLWLIERIAEP